MMLPSTQQTTATNTKTDGRIMKTLTRDQLTLSGFAGIKEHRFVTDSRLFGGRKLAETSEGLGNFVYLADAVYNPLGESGMHPHSEIDVISVILEGRVSHEGSMEHGKDLVAGDVQVQRAGGEGFDHNEINPDDKNNRMLQIWALPENKGEPAAYKAYRPAQQGVTRIYGGDKSQTDTFDSHTIIDVVNLAAGDTMTLANESLVYVTKGQASFNEQGNSESLFTGEDGSMVRGLDLQVTVTEDVNMVIVSQAA